MVWQREWASFPHGSTICANLTSSATLAEINSALGILPQWTDRRPGSRDIFHPRNRRCPFERDIARRGADQTILNAIGTAGGDVISLGSGSVAFKPFRITNGATVGSTSIEISNASGVQTGMYLAIAEINNRTYVSTAGSGGNCNWCDGDWTEKGSLARGQIVQVTGVSGTSDLVHARTLQRVYEYAACGPLSTCRRIMRESKISKCTPTIPAMPQTSACQSAHTAGSKAWNRTTPTAITLKCIGVFTMRSAIVIFRTHFCTALESMTRIFRLRVQDQCQPDRKQHHRTHASGHHAGVGSGRQCDFL